MSPVSATFSRRLGCWCLLGIAIAACAAPRAAPPTTSAGTDSIRVHGELPRTATLAITELEALGAEDVPWAARDATHAFRAVALDKVLVHLGFEAGPGGRDRPGNERHTGWRRVVIATGADGFAAAFTCAELMPELGATRAFVAWRCDGAVLPAEDGPIRLVVTTDRKRSRSVRQLVDLRVVDPTPR